jgi:hypothetical protein
MNHQDDVIAWANEQATFLQAGEFDRLDIENLYEELLDMGASYHLELEHRAAILIAHLLKWQVQPERRGNSWLRTIKEQRKRIVRRLKKTPSLKHDIDDPEWLEGVYFDGAEMARKETGLDNFPEVCPWTFEQLIDEQFFPD